MREVLQEAIYGFDDEVQSNALDAHVSRLRRKLADAGAGLEIHGIRGSAISCGHKREARMSDISLAFIGPAAKRAGTGNAPTGGSSKDCGAGEGLCHCSLRWELVSRLVWMQAAGLVALGLLVFAVLYGTGHLVALEPMTW